MVQALHDLIAQEVGARARAEEDALTTTVTTAGVQVLRDNPLRLGFVVINLGSYAVYLRPRRPATTSAGIRLVSNGGSLSVLWRDDLVLPGLDWWAISESGDSTIYLVSIIAEP